MKKVLCLLFILFALASTACAEKLNYENIQETHSIEINYPIVTLANENAADEINRFLAKKVMAYRKVFNGHDYTQGKVDYKIMYDDEDYLSIVFTYWWYYKNAAHGMYNASGIVFDKKSGKLVNLKQFVPNLNIKNLIKKINDKELTIYNQRNEKISLEKPWQIERVSHSYYIDGDKNVYLIYQPYELAAYAHGNTYIKITQEDAKNFKE